MTMGWQWASDHSIQTPDGAYKISRCKVRGEWVYAAWAPYLRGKHGRFPGPNVHLGLTYPDSASAKEACRQHRAGEADAPRPVPIADTSRIHPQPDRHRAG